MIQTLRKKFILTAMLAVTVLLLVILGGINAVNAWSDERETRELLTMLCENEPGHGAIENAPPAAPRDEPPAGFERGPSESRRLSALFFSVSADAEGEITALTLDRSASVSEEQARSLYASVGSNDAGRVGDYRYQSLTRPDGSRVTVFLDISLQRAQVLRVALLSLMAGLAGWGLMLLLVAFLSRKAIEPLAENLQRQKRFVTDAGHELKTPLAIILANTEAMELREGENKYTKNIRGQVTRLSELTQNLLSLARADEGQTPLQPEELSLAALVEEGLRPFRESAALKGLSIETELDGAVRIKADRRELARLIGILLDNAVKYAPAGSAISLSVRREGSHALLKTRNAVADTSTPPERFFDRFYRADCARTQDGGGYGIGLAAARAIADSHKFKLSAAYEGSDLVFTLKA